MYKCPYLKTKKEEKNIPEFEFGVLLCIGGVWGGECAST